MLPHLLIYGLSFIGIWIGSGLAVGAVERLAKILRVSSFMISFLVLGMFTSISETSVGVNAVISGDPEIYMGNLIGASIVLFMLIIPLLAIVGKKISISSEFQGFNLPASLVVVALPVILAMDGRVGRFDSYLTIFLFLFLVVLIQKKRGLFKRFNEVDKKSTAKIGQELLRIVFGIVIIFIASRFVVEQTEYFSVLLGLSPFVISLLLVAVGTNVPELSIVVRSVFMRSNQVAFGDYVGSAAFNTFLVGILTILYGKQVVLTNSYVVSLVFLLLGLFSFYYFARTKNSISRFEGVLLLLLYLLFIFVEVYIHKGYFSF